VAARDLRRPANRALADQFEKGLQLTQQVLQAHRYWRWCGLLADLVVLNDAGATCAARLKRWFRASAAELVNKPGGIFLRNAADLAAKTPRCSKPPLA
jgi:hypothetical protein